MAISEDNMNEELEKKISDAELVAQEPAVEEESSESLDEDRKEELEEAAPEKQGLSRARQIWRQILIWAVALVIAFAGGFFLDTLLRYQPAQDRTVDLQSDLDSANAQILSQETEIQRLGAFEDQNNSLLTELNQMNIHLVLLSVRSGVADASLALEQDRGADAKLALGKVGSTLEDLQGLLNPDQAEVVEYMIQRYELVMVELENDGSSVKTDLELLTAKLQTLENTLFASP